MWEDIINIFLEYNRNIAGWAISAKPETACRTTTTGRLTAGKAAGGESRETPVTPPGPGRRRELPLPDIGGFADT